MWLAWLWQSVVIAEGWVGCSCLRSWHCTGKPVLVSTLQERTPENWGQLCLVPFCMSFYTWDLGWEYREHLWNKDVFVSPLNGRASGLPVLLNFEYASWGKQVANVSFELQFFPLIIRCTVYPCRGSLNNWKKMLSVILPLVIAFISSCSGQGMLWGCWSYNLMPAFDHVVFLHLISMFHSWLLVTCPA